MKIIGFSRPLPIGMGNGIHEKTELTRLVSSFNINKSHAFEDCRRAAART
jgi:hypothetical protein